jgi:peptidyl-tRNA hydrolase, PTH2 family
LGAMLLDGVFSVLCGFAAGFIVRDVVHWRGGSDAPRRGSLKTGGRGSARAATKTSSSPPAQKPAAFVRPKEELKMVLCVNDALKMGKGKIGAQCAHAAVGVLQVRHMLGTSNMFSTALPCGK